MANEEKVGMRIKAFRDKLNMTLSDLSLKSGVSVDVIAAAEDGTARLGCLHDAEELLLADAPLAPLYTTVTGWELRDTLTGAVRDAQGWFSFAGVMVWNG